MIFIDKEVVLSIAVDTVAKQLYFPGLYGECRAFLSSMMGKFHVLAEININGGDVQRKNVVNNVDKSSLWAP